MLCRLIKSDSQKEKAYQFCLYIGQYFQFITRHHDDDIPLEMELEHSRTYVEMQSICYGIESKCCLKPKPSRLKSPIDFAAYN